MVNSGSVHTKFNFLCVSGTLGLEVTNTPGTAKVLALNLARFFSSNGKWPISKKLSAFCLSACFVGLVSTSYNCFFFCTQFTLLLLLVF